MAWLPSRNTAFYFLLYFATGRANSSSGGGKSTTPKESNQKQLFELHNLNSIYLLLVVVETKVRYKREEVKEELSEEELERPVAISLTETDTIWLLDIIGVAVSLEADEAEHIKERNATYDAVSCNNNDNITSIGLNSPGTRAQYR